MMQLPLKRSSFKHYYREPSWTLEEVLDISSVTGKFLPESVENGVPLHQKLKPEIMTSHIPSQKSTSVYYTDIWKFLQAYCP